MKQLLIFCLLINIAFAQQPKTTLGIIKRLPAIKSKFVDERYVDIWVPKNYSNQKKYKVVYMHDGQMLFDSTITWNKQEWCVDETFSKLIKNNQIEDCIVVGIWNNGKKRFVEYFPEDALKFIKNPSDSFGFYNRVGNNNPQANNYLLFLVEELKPLVDSLYNTEKNASGTFIMGSSMGGLISLYAICKYPKIFGGAACLSTHWPILFNNDNNPFPNLIYEYVKNNLPSAKNHKIYFDYGTATLDSLYKTHQTKIDGLMKLKNYNSKNWVTKEFLGKNHSEKAWAERLHIPIKFLLKKN